MRFKSHNLWMLFAVLLAFTACKKDDPIIDPIIDPIPDPDPVVLTFTNGKFIVNEGVFNQSNASISYYDFEGDSVVNNIFKNINERPLGDIAQSLTTIDDKIFIAVNGSGKIEVVNTEFFGEEGVINDVTGVRYILPYLAPEEKTSTKAFVSTWSGAASSEIKVLNLETLAIDNTIEVGAGAEGMIIEREKLYVCNSGGWGLGSTVSVISVENEEVITTLNVGDSPRGIVRDVEGNLWVLCAGSVVYDTNPPYEVLEETPSKLVKITPRFDKVIDEIIIGENIHPGRIAINTAATEIYYGGGFGFDGIYKFNFEAETAPTEKFIDQSAYGFSVNAENDNLFVCVAPSYVENGVLYRYDALGNEIANYEVGISPNGVGTKKTK